MKKLLFVMLAAFVCVSCSKDESDLAPNDGQLSHAPAIWLYVCSLKVVVALTLHPT